MKKIRTIIILLLFLGAVYFLLTRIPVAPADKTDIKVLLIYSDMNSGRYDYVMEAYKSVLEEEGVSFTFQNPTFLLSSNPADLVKYFPAIIFADGLAQSLPSDMGPWIKEYLKEGGHTAVIYDAGTKDIKNQYRNKAIFTDLTGVDYILYNRMMDSGDSYTSAYIRFKDKPSADFFQVPPGKIDDKFFINGYSYGQLTFPIARVKEEKFLDKNDIYAYSVTDANEVYPLLVLRKVILGNILYVNLPLGHIKANSDDFLIRAILRTFLFDIVKIPHLAPTPGGKGGLVINWHIDWNQDWEGLTFMKQNGYFTPHIQYSLHNTAGEFTDKPGDGLGFDACGKGKKYLQDVLKYGTLGSHGGWAHNWFYINILNGAFGEKEIEHYIVKNSRCLESISGYPVTEYSAPNGVHPQPLTTRILEKLGIIAYYYTGDTGSAPNRTFYDKKMISQTAIAFPILTLRENASFYEMAKKGVTGAEFFHWLSGLLDFVEKNRTVRLIYSHSYDVAPYYPQELKKFIDMVEEKAVEKKINAQPMSFFARFLMRFLKTKTRFIAQTHGMDIRLENPEGLIDITAVIPKDKFLKPSLPGIAVDEDDRYYYLKILETAREQTLHVDYINR